MNFKADWSFLDKVSMGAKASKAVIDILNASGHNVIELERSSTRNKIWATKIKRLRMPDLICLKCGKRIESRAKSKLEVRMSDNENNPDRRWDAGLRDEDLIAFIRCQKIEDEWTPADEINLFETKSLRRTEDKSKLGRAKSAGEGAERYRIWKTTIPKADGVITEIIPGSPRTKIRVEYTNNRSYTYSVEDSNRVYCNAMDRFKAYSTMIAGIPLKKESISGCSDEQYDFVQDLSSERVEIRYAGVKALGYLPFERKYVEALEKLKDYEDDTRIKLEIYSSLIRLGIDKWDEFYEYAMSIEDPQYSFEYVLILGELNNYDKANDTLSMIARNYSFETEMRAASAWGIKVQHSTLHDLIEIAQIDEPKVCSHAISHIIADYDDDFTDELIQNEIVSDKSGSVALKILTESGTVNPETVVERYLQLNDSLRKRWIAMSIGIGGKDRYGSYARRLKEVDRNMYEFIKLLWNYKEHEISNDESSEIEFLLKQTL